MRSRLLQSFVHAPHLIDAELGNAVRRHEREARLSPEESLQVLRAARAVVDRRYPHAGPLAERAWAWRHHVSFYDALYLALAVSLNVPLVTADTRLSRMSHPPCAIEVV